jgi:hypothetical protein
VTHDLSRDELARMDRAEEKCRERMMEERPSENVETSDCPKPGIYPGVPFAEYRGWDAINASFLTTLSRRTPYHAKHDRDFPTDETPALRMGRALHSYVLEPATFEQCWSVCPACDKRTKEGKALYAAFLEAKGARDEIGEKDFTEIKELAHEIRKQQAVNLLVGGRAEVSIVWEDDDTGLLCKRRLDYERPGGGGDWNHYITDLKSSDDIGPFAFGRDIAGYGYALAAAFSIDGWKAVAEGEDSIYTLLAVEKDYHISKAWVPDDDTLAAGRAHYQQALATAKKCIADGVWPDYGRNSEFIRAPEWYLREHGIGPFNMI